ncbi:MAG: HTH domain-containing protein [Spirochaetaceae bacterium]
MKVNNKQIIISLLKESNLPISGENISNKIGISRTGVWKNIQKLTEEGYTITSSTKGYLLKQETDLLLSYEFDKDRELYLYKESTSSTMDLAKELINSGKAVDGTVVIAGDQTSGKSKGSGKFESPQGGLYFTLILFPNCPIMDVNLYPMAATLATKDILFTELNLNIGIVWPFESWLDEVKVSGVLHNYLIENNRVTWVNIGIGINLSKDIPRRELLIKIREKILNYLDNRDKLFETYSQNLNKEQSYSFNIEGKKFIGNISGVDRLGTLTIDTKNGKEYAYIGNSNQEDYR